MFVTSRMDFILFQFYKVCIKCLCVIISREDVRQIAKVHYDILTTSLSFPPTHTHTHTDTLSLRHTHTLKWLFSYWWSMGRNTFGR